MMMRAGTLITILTVLFTSCIDKTKVPSGVLPHEKMEAVMWDVIQSEQYSNSYLTKDSAKLDLKLENLKLYDAVFRLHHVSREEFTKSYQYYMSRADLSETLFDSLLQKGNRLRTESYSRPHPYVAPTPTPPAPGAPVPNTPNHTAPPATQKAKDSSLRLKALPHPLADSARRRHLFKHGDTTKSAKPLS